MIRLGIVGCGRILNAHLQGLLRLIEKGVDDFRVTALVARQRDDALMFAQRGEGPPPRPPVLDPSTGDPLAAPHTYVSDLHSDVDVGIFSDFREMVESATVDAVIDLTALDVHHLVADCALQAGLHLHTQKPLAVSVRAGQRMIRQAKEHSCVLGVFENVRQSLAGRAAAWAVRTGRIGSPQLAISGSLGGLWSPTKVVAETPWRHQKVRGGGGGTIDIGVHQFHGLRHIFGEIAWVSGHTPTLEPKRYMPADTKQENPIEVDVDDTHLACFGFVNGAIGQLLWSWGLHGPPVDVSGAPAYYGSEGAIVGGQLHAPSGTSVPLADLYHQEVCTEERQRHFPLDLTDAFAIQGLDFLSAIQNQSQIETSAHEGLMDLACSFAMIESSHLKRQVTLDEILDNSADGYQRQIDVYHNLV